MKQKTRWTLDTSVFVIRCREFCSLKKGLSHLVSTDSTFSVAHGRYRHKSGSQNNSQQYESFPAPKPTYTFSKLGFNTRSKETYVKYNIINTRRIIFEHIIYLYYGLIRNKKYYTGEKGNNACMYEAKYHLTLATHCIAYWKKKFFTSLTRYDFAIATDPPCNLVYCFCNYRNAKKI